MKMNNIEDIVKYTSKMKLLYVENDSEARDTGGFLLEDIFEEIIIAIDGQDALEKFKQNKIDVIITDINMPILNGLDMLEEIKKLDTEVSTIILSAYMKSEYFMQSIKLGVDGYLVKPIDMDNLFEILKKIVVAYKLKEQIDKNTGLKEQKNRYLQTVIDSAYEPVIVIKEDYAIELINSSYRIKHQNIDEDIKNQKCYEAIHGRSSPCSDVGVVCPLQEVLSSKKKLKIIHKRKDKYIEVSATPLLDDDKNCTSIVESERDVTKQIEEQEKLLQEKESLHHKAHYDLITGLANRTLFNDRLEQSTLRAKRQNSKVALFFIDLDKFKYVNDTYGHKAGDIVLQKVGKLMKSIVREEDAVARIGGDEFAIIIENLSHPDSAIKLGEKIIDAIEVPIKNEDYILNISASIGLSIYPDSSLSCETLLKYADIAMYEVKKQKTKRVLLYSEIGDFDESSND